MKKTNLPTTRAELDKLMTPERLYEIAEEFSADATALFGPEAFARVKKRFLAEAKDRVADMLNQKGRKEEFADMLRKAFEAAWRMENKQRPIIRR